MATAPTTTTNAAIATETQTPTKQAATKSRIITHMNKDHAESLSLYLQHYLNIPASQTQNPVLQNLTLDSLIIQAEDGETYTVPVVPPMESWSDVRLKVVAMDREAREALGLEPLGGHGASDGGNVNGNGKTKKDDESRLLPIQYAPPTSPVHIFMVGLVAFFFSSYFLLRTSRGLVPGTWYYEHVMSRFPLGGAEGYTWLQRNLVLPAVGLHGAEALWMAKRLGDQGLGPRRGWRTRTWWAWVGSTFLEGWGAHARFGNAVRGKDGGKTKGN